MTCDKPTIDLNRPAAATKAKRTPRATPADAAPLVVIAGGSGFIGEHLTRQLVHQGYRVVILTRKTVNIEAVDLESPAVSAVRFVQWDGMTAGPWAESLEGATAVINLAGRHVNCRYNAKNRQEIMDSRVQSVAVLGAAIKQCHRPPSVWVQAATLAIYGDRGNQELTESAHTGEGFSPQVAVAWEQAAANAVADLPVRKVILRISFVLGQGGGALPTLARIAKLGLGGSVGDGQQYYSWIHNDDLCTIIQRAITDPKMTGVFNVTSPKPVRNHVFMKQLRKAVHRPWSPSAPAWAVKIGCFFMGTEAELALRSRYGVPARLQVMGHVFKFNELHHALADLYPSTPHHTRPHALTRTFDF